jgi:eukaryotic-like serine/threonine-protein kinase
MNLTPGQPPLRTTFSPLTNTNGVVSMLEAHENSAGGGCQRAMTTRRNIVVDVSACRADLVNQAIDILNAIVANIPK